MTFFLWHSRSHLAQNRCRVCCYFIFTAQFLLLILTSKIWPTNEWMNEWMNEKCIYNITPQMPEFPSVSVWTLRTPPLAIKHVNNAIWQTFVVIMLTLHSIIFIGLHFLFHWICKLGALFYTAPRCKNCYRIATSCWDRDRACLLLNVKCDLRNH